MDTATVRVVFQPVGMANIAMVHRGILSRFKRWRMILARL